MMEGRMKKIGIVCAGDKEFEPFIPIIDECKITEKAMLKFYEGRIGDVEVVVNFGHHYFFFGLNFSLACCLFRKYAREIAS